MPAARRRQAAKPLSRTASPAARRGQAELRLPQPRRGRRRTRAFKFGSTWVLVPDSPGPDRENPGYFPGQIGVGLSGITGLRGLPVPQWKPVTWLPGFYREVTVPSRAAGIALTRPGIPGRREVACSCSSVCRHAGLHAVQRLLHEHPVLHIPPPPPLRAGPFPPAAGTSVVRQGAIETRRSLKCAENGTGWPA